MAPGLGSEPLASDAGRSRVLSLGAIAAQALAWDVAGIATNVSALVSVDDQDGRTGVERRLRYR